MNLKKNWQSLRIVLVNELKYRFQNIYIYIYIYWLTVYENLFVCILKSAKEEGKCACIWCMNLKYMHIIIQLLLEGFVILN